MEVQLTSLATTTPEPRKLASPEERKPLMTIIEERAKATNQDPAIIRSEVRAYLGAKRIDHLTPEQVLQAINQAYRWSKALKEAEANLIIL